MKTVKRSAVVVAMLMVASGNSQAQFVYSGGEGTMTAVSSLSDPDRGRSSVGRYESVEPPAYDSDSEMTGFKEKVYDAIQNWTEQILGRSDQIAAGSRSVALTQVNPPFLATAQTDPSTTVRLFLDAAESIPAPTGTTLWLIADLSHNGIPTGQATTQQIQDMLSGTGDDRLFFEDTVDGTLLGSQAGKYQRVGISVPGDYQDASIGLVLWNDANQSGTIGDVADTYGYFGFGVVPPPDLGNALYLITGDVHADENLVAVPEPSQISAGLGLLCITAAILRRLHQTVRCF